MSALEAGKQFGVIVDELEALVCELNTPNTGADQDVAMEDQHLGAKGENDESGVEWTQRLELALTNIRNTEKKVNSSINKFSKSIPSDPETKPLVTATSANNALLEQAILRHLLHQGHTNAAENLVDESRLLEADQPAISTYTELNTILSQIEAGSIDTALEWAESHREFLEKATSSLFFDLYYLVFTQRLEQSRIEALKFLRQVGHQSFGHGLAGIPLMLINPPPDYSTLEAKESFRWWYLLYNGCSPVSQLELAAKAGFIALPYLSKSYTLLKSRRAEWTSLNELPVSIPLPSELQFHPVFVCPVSKEQTSSENPPYILNCGHILAKATLKQLQRVDFSKRTVKCPYCPEHCSIESIVQVVFSSE